LAAASFVAVGVMFWRIWFRPFTVISVPPDPSHGGSESLLDHFSRLGQGLALFAGVGLLLALLGTLGEVRFYEKPATDRGFGLT
jgi:hypothetical protein